MGAGVSPDDGFNERAARRRATAWARIVSKDAAGEDDPDDVKASASERVALVDTLSLMALRNGLPDGIEPRLQRSAARVFRRRR